MKIFTTKVSAIILSTIIICNKYPAIGNKSVFFTPVYAAIPQADLRDLDNSMNNILSQMNRKEKNSYEIPRDLLNNVNQAAYYHLTHFMAKNGDCINSIPTPSKIKGRNPKHLSNKDLVEYISKRLSILRLNSLRDNNPKSKDMHKLWKGIGVWHERLFQAISTDQRDLVHQALQNNGEDDDSLTIFENASQVGEDDTDSITSSENSSQVNIRGNDEAYSASEHDSLEHDEPIEALKSISDNNSTVLSSSSSDYNHLTPRFHSTIHKARTLVFPQISRKVRGDKYSQRIVGASSDNNMQGYEIEVKYLYSTTTIPQTNGNSKSNIHGLLINLKRQISNKLTIGGFYSPTVTNTTFTNAVNNSGYTNHISGNVDHLFGIYTSYAITPVTYLSNQLAFGVTRDDDSSNDKKYPNYFIIDSFLSHKINIDATKTIAPEFGLSYYSSNSSIPDNSSSINNLSLITGIKFQYRYQYNNVEFSPSIKLSHVRPLYSNITSQIQKLRLKSTAGTSIYLLRDFQSVFDPHSSIRCSFAIRHDSIRLEGGYGFITYHNIEHNYTHTLFAKLNLSL